MAGRRHVILGDGAAGVTAAETLRRLDPAGSITVVSDDPHPAYFRAALTNYLLGELREDRIWAVPPSFYRDLGVSRVFARAAAVDTAAALVHLTGGERLPYEALLIATGARARPAPFASAHLPGVLALRTLQDARAVLDHLATTRPLRALVVGGGPLGLEWAHALRERGATVTLLARGERLMPEVLDVTASDLLIARLTRGGIEVRLGDEVAEAIAGPGGRVAGATTRRGHQIACDLIAVAVGVACNVELLGGSGVALGPRGGALVDDRMATSVASVYAAGDVAEHRGRLLQLWEPARRMAAVAAANMAGAEAVYAPGAHYFATRLHDLDFAAVGATEAEPGDVVITARPRTTGRIAHRRLVLRDDQLRGALMIGERSEGVRRRGRLYQRLIDLGLPVSGIRGALLDDAFDLRAWIETRSLVARPLGPDPDPAAAVRPADVRATQRMTLPLAAMGAAAQAPTVRAGPLGVELGALTERAAPPAMLSIGLCRPDPVAPSITAAVAPAFLDAPDRRWALDREVVSLGRGAPATVTLDDPEVSLRHAEIVCHAGARWLRDSGSRAGTWINGARVTTPHALRDGDRLRLGATTLTFRGGPAAAPPAVQPTTPDAIGIPVLEIRKGRGVGLTFALSGPEVTVGRDPESAVRLDDLSVSRRHARLIESAAGWTITDLESSRGTRRNGKHLAPGEAAPLDDGDVIAVGDVELGFTRRAPAAERA